MMYVGNISHGLQVHFMGRQPTSLTILGTRHGEMADDSPFAHLYIAEASVCDTVAD